MKARPFYIAEGRRQGAFFSDDEYKASGAILVDGEEPEYSKSRRYPQVKEPLFT